MSKIHKLYSELAPLYDDFIQNKEFIREAEFVFQSIGAQNNHPHILELGCGTGCHLFALASFGCIVTGIDKSKDMLTLAMKKCPTSKIIECDFESNWPVVVENSYDAVVCLGTTIAYVAGYERIALLLSKLETVIKPNGFFIFDLWKTAGCSAGCDFEKIIKKRNGCELIRASEWIPEGDLLISKDCFVILPQDREPPQVVFDTHKLFLFDVSKLEHLLTQRGWIVEVYDGFKKRRFNDREQRAVFVAMWPST